MKSMAAASSKDLKSEDQLDEVASGISVGCREAEKLISEYSFDTSPEWLKKPFTLFGFSSIPTQISALISHAGPLDMVEAYIKTAYRKIPDIFSRTFNVDGMQGTLCQLPIIGVDQNITDEKGVVIDEGMAEMLMGLHAELSPATYPIALEQARLAAPLEDEKEKTEREATNFAALNTLFDALKKNDANTDLAVETFKEFVKNTKPKVMTDNRYYLNLIHLLHGAVDVLARRGGELEDEWYGALGDRFCYKIIAAVIESAVSPRTKQILKSGVYDLFINNEKAQRVIDIGGQRFSGVGTNFVLGVNYFYDSNVRTSMSGGGAEYWVYKTYYEQLCQHPKFIIQRPQTHSSTRCLIL